MSPINFGQTLPLATVLLLLSTISTIIIVIGPQSPWVSAQLSQQIPQTYQLSQPPQTIWPTPQVRGGSIQQPPPPPPNQPHKSPCPRALKISSNPHYRGSLHYVCLQASATGRGWPRLDVVRDTNQQVVMSMEVMETGTEHLASFVDEMGNLRILLAKPNRINGTSMYSLDLNGQFINETHTINTQFVSALSVWRMELNWEFHLAIANQPTYDLPTAPNHDLRPMISMFTWRSTYFDVYQIIYLPEGGRVNKLEPMYINGQEFLIVAMESNRISEPANAADATTKPHGSDSLIYKLDFSDGTLKWAQYQSMNTRVALDAKSFVIGHQGSLQRDYYIALIGQAKQDPQEPWNFYNNNNNVGGGNMTTNHGQSGAADEPYGLVIYKYFGDKFRRTEHMLPAPWATKLDTITSAGSDRDSYVIIALAGPNHVNLYQFDGLKLSLMPDSITGPIYQLPIMEIIMKDAEKQLLEQQERNDTNAYSKRDQIMGGENLLAWCRSKVGELMNDNFDLSARKLLALPRVDQATPIELSGDLIVEQDLHVSNLLYTRQILEKFEHHQNIVEAQPFFGSQTFEQIHQAHGQIGNIERQVERILVDDGSQQDVFRPLAFDTIQVECGTPANFGDPRFSHQSHGSGFACPQVDQIRTTWLNSRNISSIEQQALLTNRPMEIRSDVRFEHLILRDRVDILDTLNGIQINDIVFKRGRAGSNGGRIQGHKNFLGNLYSSSRLGVSSWHGAVLDGDNFLTSVGSQRVDVNLRFAQIVIDSPPEVGQVNMTPSSRIENLNGIHLDTHLDRITLQDDNNHFEVPLHVDELILNGPTKMTESSHLCQVDVEDLWSNTMFKHHNQNITAPMHFTGFVHIAYGGDIQVDGLVNGVQLRPGKVLMRDGNHNQTTLIRNPILFEGDVNVRELTLEKHLNGIQVAINRATGRHELAILYNGGTQQVTGDKVFGQIHLGGNSSIYGNINGDLNITDLYRMANVNRMPHNFGTIHLTRGTNYRVADGVNIHVDGSINGIPVDDICSLANRYTQLPQLAHKRLKFDHQPVSFRSLHCGSINGFNDLTKSFMTRHGNQLIRGTLKLTNGAIFNTSLNIRSTLNNMPVTPLAGAIARTVNETRSGHKEVRGDLVLDDLYVDRINDLRLSNVFLSRSDEPQIPRAPMIFDQLDIENVLVIGKNLITDTFNGLNVTDILTNTLQYDTPQVVYNHVELATLQLLSNSSFLTKSFNGHDLQRLFADSVLKDVPQQILAPKTFRAPTEFMEHAYLRHGLNELTADEFRSNMLLHSDEIIEGDLEFENDVIIRKELEIQSGLINDIDVNLFVDSIVHENRNDRKPMRVVNGSVRFKDVQVHNLVVGGRIQGVDLSRDALLKSDNLNGTYDARLREQQVLINNQRLLNSRYGPGSSFQVSSKYHGSDHQGTCYVHSCLPRTTLAPTSPLPPPPQAQLPSRIHQQPSPPPHPLAPAPTWAPLVHPQPAGFNNRPPITFVQQFYPNLSPQRPQSLVLSHNTTPVLQPTWAPRWDIVVQGPPPLPPPHSFNQTTNHYNTTRYEDMFSPLFDSRYLEHKSMTQAQAISDLATRINRYLSISFYYEIVQKHPLLGPLLHAARNPIPNEQAGNLLLLKATSKPGEPCLQRGQTIAVMAQQTKLRWNNMVAFTQSSRIQETSNPSLVDSVVVDQGGYHYLFILDSYPEGNSSASSSSMMMVSRLIIYLWDQGSGMYELRESITVDGYPTVMKAFTLNHKACVAVANPRLVVNSNSTGAPVLHCQRGPLSKFNLKIQLPLTHVFDLDIVALPQGMQIVVAALSQQHTEQIGDLSVGVYNLADNSWTGIASRRMVRPMKLHLFRNILRPANRIELVVSEAITSSDDTQAMTRIFALKFNPLGPGTSFQETQIIRDNQFYDIQSVHSMLFLQSAHSISIYAPSSCDDQYSLAQRLPTKGANKFLVFSTNNSRHHDHFLVLSQDGCAEQQNYATVILKSKFI